MMKASDGVPGDVLTSWFVAVEYVQTVYGTRLALSRAIRSSNKNEFQDDQFFHAKDLLLVEETDKIQK